MRVLLTGAGGFLGRNVLARLNGSYDEVHVLQRGPLVPSPASSPTGDTSVIAHGVDLFDRRSVAETLSRIGATHLCHLAWLGPEHTDRYRSPDNARWVEASAHLFDAFMDAGGRRLIQVGSCIEYGNSVEGVVSEDRPLEPDTAYAEAKAQLSIHVEGMAADGVSAAVARPFFAYGPHEQETRLVPSIVLALNRGEPIELTDGRQRRDYLHASDIADAMIALLREEAATGSFNVGAGIGVEVRSIAQHLGVIAGRTDLLRFGARPEGADTSAEIVADISRITSVTEWKPIISLDQGLDSTTRWWRDRAEGAQVGDGTAGQHEEGRSEQP